MGLQKLLVLTVLAGLATSNHERRHATSPNPTSAASPLRSTPLHENSSSSPLVDDPTVTLTCTECTSRDLKRSYRLESIKSDILRKLRLSAPPNVTGKTVPNVPALNQIITRINGEKDCERLDTDTEPDEDRMLTMRVIQFSTPGEAPASSRQSSGFIYFQLPSVDIRETSQVINASLGLYIRTSASRSHPPAQTWILVYRLGPASGSEPSISQERSLIRRKKIALTVGTTGMWYHFDVKNVVESWMARPDSNHGFLVYASNSQGEPLVVTEPQNEYETSHKPYLEIETRSIHVERGRRGYELDCDESSVERRCCRYPLTVDFNSFGWDWIIVPKRYHAYYCSGDCPFLYFQHDVHGHMVRQAKPDGAGMPCCSPKWVSSISMLYYDDNMNIVYGRLPGMVVERCGCA